VSRSYRKADEAKPARGRRLTSRRGLLVIVSILALAVVLVVGLFVFRDITVRSTVGIAEAELRDDDVLALVVHSCNGDPEISDLDETDDHVRVEVIASSTPLSGGGDCLDLVEISLQEPLGDRVLIDADDGETVDVIGRSSD
jgi:hypothetical protein